VHDDDLLTPSRVDRKEAKMADSKTQTTSNVQFHSKEEIPEPTVKVIQGGKESDVTLRNGCCSFKVGGVQQ
jgi:hypothetical protein